MRSLVNFRHTGIKLGASQSLRGDYVWPKKPQTTDPKHLLFLSHTDTHTFKRIFTAVIKKYVKDIMSFPLKMCSLTSEQTRVRNSLCRGRAHCLPHPAPARTLTLNTEASHADTCSSCSTSCSVEASTVHCLHAKKRATPLNPSPAAKHT